MPNIRLSLENMDRVETIQAYFRELKPISVDLSPTDVVTIALRDLCAVVTSTGVVSQSTTPERVTVPGPYYLVVPHEDDPVLCPGCGKSTRKTVHPNRPVPVPKNAQYSRDIGQAFCENPDCVLADAEELISWVYEIA